MVCDMSNFLLNEYEWMNEWMLSMPENWKRWCFYIHTAARLPCERTILVNDEIRKWTYRDAGPRLTNK